MAFKIKQENYGKRATPRQKKLLRFLGVSIPPTRIEAHLKIVSIKSTLEGALKIAEYKLVSAMEGNHAQTRSDRINQPASNNVDAAAPGR
jgi:uncharacterized protein YbcI